MTEAVESAAPPPPAEPGYEAGELVAGKFRLQRLLGEGGMGWVWVAHDEQLDVDLAIKLIRSDVSVPAAAERLLTEARALARLEHPGIVHVVDFGRTERNDPFIAMELLEGEDLGQVLDREERLTPIKAVQVLLPAAEALGAAHTRGIVHRDLKPDNIFLVRQRKGVQPKVIDFGIAKLDLETKHTQAGVALGSPDYMAPEQARGQRDVDHRADIWAFCILIYETITGHVPFEDASYNAVLRHVIESPIPPIFEHGVDAPELWAILQRGFEKDRDKRWQSMRELGTALANWLMDQGVFEDAAGRSLRVVWIEPPRPSLLSIPDVRFATGEVPRLETSSSIPPITEAHGEAPAVSRNGKLALAGLGVFLAGVLGALVLMHRSAPDTHAAALPADAMSAATPVAPPTPPAPAPVETAPPVASDSPVPSASAPAATSAPAPVAHASTRTARRWKPKAHAWKPKARSAATSKPKKAAAPAASAWKPPKSDDLGF